MVKYEVDGTSARAPREDGPSLRLVDDTIGSDVSGHNGIAPDSSKKVGGFKKTPKLINFAEAAERLRGGEVAASRGVGQRDTGGLDEVKEKEDEGGGLYSGNGKESGSKSGKNSANGIVGWLQKNIPMGLIFGLIFGIAGVIGGSQLFQPFSLLAQFQETFNSMHISANTRSQAFFRMQMDSGRVKNPIKGKIFGADTFKITKKQAARLSQQGIDYDNDFEGTGVRVLKFDDGSGEIRVVAADEKSLSKLNDAISIKNAGSDITTKYNADAITFDKLYMENADFYNGYNKGSMTWRGAIANWFSTKTAEFLNSNKITRNLFQDFQEKVAAANEGNTRTVATDMIAKRADEIEDGGIKLVGADEDVKDEEGKVIEEGGKKVTKGVDTSEVVPSESSNPNGANFRDSSIDTNASSAGYSNGSDSSKSSRISRSNMDVDAVKGKLQSISGTVQKGANIACAALNVVGAVSLLVTASEALQIINLVSAYFEAIDKVKAGDGSDSPIHELTGALNERKTNTHTEIVSTNETWNNNDQNSNFINGGDGGIKTLDSKETESTKTAMESSGIVALYSGGKVDVNDASVKSFNFTSSIKSILGGIGVSMKAFETCAIAKIAANVTSAALDAITIAGCILGLAGAAFTFGVSASACGPFVTNSLVGMALGVAIGVTVAGIIAAIVPTVASMMTRDLINDIGGEDLGNALTSGANMYLGNTHRSNGGSLATIDQYESFALAQNQVIAENAKYERQTKDPFDITSKYTFMGTLLTQLMNFTSATSLTKVITSSSSVVSNSIVALTPTASAYDVAKTLPESIEEYADTCPYLASIGAIGDAYCNPYSVTDMSTINEDPSAVIEKISDNFQEESTSDGNVKINGNSDLAKYIIYCDQRESAFGIADQNIANSVDEWSARTGSSGLDTGVNAAIGAVPVLGDVIDVMSNSNMLENLGYISGESCVAGNTVNNTKAPGWNEAKYYQRFIEDQSLAETMGLIEESAVTAFVREYREEHPLDNSYEGILARYSGLTKDDVVAVLDFVEYANYVANYDPSERYAFGMPAVEIEKELKFDNDNKVADNIWGILLGYISYADLRNRSFAI